MTTSDKHGLHTTNLADQDQKVQPLALVVDDEPLVAMYLSDTLEEMGFKVMTAGSVASALEATTAERVFTVAFIDLGLPDKTGLELIAELQKTHPNLPVVIASGYGSMAQNDLNESNRPPAFLTKPYDATVIAKVLKELGISIRSDL